MKPEREAQEREMGDRDFAQRREQGDREFQGRDADRQAKIEDMRARQAQAAQRQQRNPP